MVGTIDGHQRKIISLSKEINNLEAKKTKICEWVRKHGIKDDAFDDLPF